MDLIEQSFEELNMSSWESTTIGAGKIMVKAIIETNLPIS
jgi:hypothetical protein